MPFLRFSIRLKLILSFFLMSLAIISGFSMFLYYRTSNSLQEELFKRGIELSKTFTQMAAANIFESDFITVLDNAREMLQHNDIQSITVITDKGKRWISTDVNAPLFTEVDAFHQSVIQTRKLKLRKILVDDQWLIECLSPVIALNKVPYLIEIHISLKDIETQLEKSSRNILLLSVGLLGVAIILGIFSSNLLTGPIKQLVQGTREISKGNLSYRINLTCCDEIGDLALSFNLMAEILQTELSERELVEAELRRHRDHLEDIVKERTRENQQVIENLKIEMAERRETEKKKAQLEERLQRAGKMEAIGTLAGGVAHDLNNILTGIVGYPDLLLLQLPEDSDLRKPLETIQKSGLRAAAIVQDLLTLARRGIATQEVVSLNTIIMEVMQSPEYGKLTSSTSSVQVKTELDEHLMNILGSPVHLSKSLMNIIANAFEAMPEGGSLSISTSNCYLDHPINGYESVSEGNFVVIRIADSGMGIAEKDIERIFEPFFTTKKMGKSGSGLGMAVVWGTVKDHKGYIDVQSRPGQGTIFTLYFPVTRQTALEAEIRPSLQALKGRGEFILVVDDVENQRKIASSILRELNYKVHAVASGEEAVNYLTSHHADLVVLDMIMEPGIDGLETYQRILRLHPRQKAVIVSGYAENDCIAAARELGATRYIKKPYMLENIGLAIREELHQSSYEAEPRQSRTG